MPLWPAFPQNSERPNVCGSIFQCAHTKRLTDGAARCSTNQRWVDASGADRAL